MSGRFPAPFLCLSLLLVGSCQHQSPLSPGPLPSQEPLTRAPGVHYRTVPYGGLARQVIYHFPADLQATKPYPVVFFFHGLGGSMEMGRATFGTIVDSAGVIGIYPQGHQDSWNTGGREVPSRADDVGFTLHLLDQVRRVVSIDHRRVYAAGYSNGGAFSYYLALQTDTFASVASLSASLFADRTVPSTAARTSVVQIHGDSDDVVPYWGGRSVSLPISFASALDSVRAWAVHDGLPALPEVGQAGDRLLLHRFMSPGSPYEARLYTLQSTTHDINQHWYHRGLQCYRDIWQFFEQHPKE